MAPRFTLAVALAMGLAARLPAQVDEYQVKAFFLYNFTRYIEWPAQSFSGPADPIVICILGRDPFGGALEQATAGKVVDGRSFLIRQIPEIQPKCGCHILFVSASERKRFRSMFAAIRGSGVLAVGEGQGFTDDGGVINFKLEDGKVRFEINVEAAGQERLRISSKLLSLARIVRK
jgi:YfiR/HmsC-like